MLVDRVHISNEQAVDQKLEKRAVRITAWPQNLVGGRKLTTPARHDSDAGATFNVRNLAGQPIKRVKKGQHVVTAQRALAGMERLSDARRSDGLDDVTSC